MKWPYIVLVTLLFRSPCVSGLIEFHEYCRQHNECVCFTLEFQNADFAVQSDSKPYECKSLTFLNSTIQTIPGNIFLITTEVQEANFPYSGIKYLQKVDFKRAVKLKKLDLDANLITELKNEVFSNAPELGVLKLSFNKIYRVEQKAFHNLEKLQELYLNGNAIRFLVSKLFDHMNLLRVVDLQDNQIQALPEEIFEKNRNMEVLNLANNQLKFVQQNGEAFLRQETTFGLWDPLKNLQKLSLNGNQAVLISEDAFESLSSLRELDLSRLEISKIERGAFKNQHHLTHLDLAYNLLREADAALFSSLKSLRTLSLRGNFLSQIDIHAFLDKFNSTRINLMKNSFSCLVVDNIKSIVTLGNRNLEDFMSYWEEEADFGEDCKETPESKEFVTPFQKDTDKDCNFLKAVSLQLEKQKEEFDFQFGLLRQKLEAMEATLDRIHRDVKPRRIFV